MFGMEQEYIEPKRPDDWPRNFRERLVGIVYEQVLKFEEDPSSENKEVLISFISQGDINEVDNRGVFRVTEYEVVLINSLYLFASVWLLNSLKVFLYKRILDIAQQAHMLKIMNQLDMSLKINDSLIGLVPTLSFAYSTYINFRVDKRDKYSDQIVFELENMIGENLSVKDAFRVSQIYNTFLCDICSFHSSSVLSIFKFDRLELAKLIEVQCKLNKLSNQNPFQRPLKGLLFVTLSNWILKSRSGYNSEFLQKCMPDFAARSSVLNREVWMRKRDKMNDEREGVVIKEIFDRKDWQTFEWMKTVKPKEIRKTYTSSFVRSVPDKDMKEKYGPNIFAYKNDYLADLLSPTYYHNNIIRFSQVMHYDVLYSVSEFKEEINFLCELISMYGMSETENKEFLEEILDYWIFSIKDEEDWKTENERRYEIILYDHYNYIDCKEEDDYLKVNSTLFMFPDFINPENIMKREINLNRIEKLSAISTKDYLFCRECLYSDFDSVNIFKENKSSCSNCGSANVYKVNGVEYTIN